MAAMGAAVVVGGGCGGGGRPEEVVALPHDMEVRVTDDVPEGVMDQSTQPDGRTIWIPASFLTETHKVLTKFVEEVESEGGRPAVFPEQKFTADGFASFYTVNEEGKEPALAAAMLFDEIAREQGDPTMEQFASDHPITQQRVYNFLCLLEGSDPENLHGPLVAEGY